MRTILCVVVVFVVGIVAACSEQAQTQRTLTDGPQTGQTETYIVNMNGINVFVRHPATPTTQPTITFSPISDQNATMTVSGGTTTATGSPSAGSQESQGTNTGGAQDATNTVTPTVDANLTKTP